MPLTHQTEKASEIRALDLGERSATIDGLKVAAVRGRTTLSSAWGSVLFPLAFIPRESYKQGMRRFMANRPNGRKHAGCDLYGFHGCPVFAVADGIVKDHSQFYLGTFQITIEHAGFTARYGEVQERGLSAFTPGAKVNEGTCLGYMGEMPGIKNCMLHFEMYSGVASGALTNRTNKPTQRRSDLMDPTPYLDRWARELLLEDARSEMMKSL